jgi:poly-gamma-glutamate capsule biosynthesis protein CapA/YwtB (metallophosphatase superfamily)
MVAVLGLMLVAALVGARPSEPPARQPSGATGSEDAPTEPRAFTIAAAGDILPHMAVIESAARYGEDHDGADHDFRPMFAEVAPWFLAADLAVCHLEAPLSGDNQDVVGGGEHRLPSGAPRFNAPFELADAIADAGFDTCSTAHNHSSDAGPRGIIDTIDRLEHVGVVPVGTAAEPQDAQSAHLHEVEGVTVAHLAATYGLNDPLPDDQAWMVDEIDPEWIVDEAASARADGADFVIVSLHHGLDYQVEPSDNQRERADVLLGSGEIDLLIGHHAHVVQPIERVHDRVTVHGLGNLLSNMHPRVTGPRTQDGVIVTIEVVEEPGSDGFVVGDVAYVPTWVDRDTHEIVDVGATLASGERHGEPLTEDRRAELEASWARTVDAITSEGADDWGVAPVETRP